MIAELASARACELVRGQFRGLRDPKRADVVTGALWIRDCKITNDGTRATFQLRASGWQWAAQSQTKAGATFALRQYVRFDAAVTMRGAFDIGYAPKSHVVSLWFSPTGKPEIEFTPVGELEVDRTSAWASILGGLSSVFSDSPEQLAETTAKQQGTQQFQTTLADGLAVTIDLCTGLSRFNLGRLPKGKMQPADVGETKRVPLELQPGGVMIAGPQLATRGMTVHAETTRGGARVALMCAKDAETIAGNFLAGRPTSARPVLGQVDVRGKAKLAIKPAKCPVVTVAWPLQRSAVTFSLLRLPSEIARSTGGPLLQCK